MKRLEDYSWDQLHSYRYDVYPYRLIVVSPLEYEKIKLHFREFISDSSIRKDHEFADYLQEVTGEPAIAAMFYDDSFCNKKIFSEIATMTQRVKTFTLFA